MPRSRNVIQTLLLHVNNTFVCAIAEYDAIHEQVTEQLKHNTWMHMDTHALVPATTCPLRARLLVLGVVLTAVVIIATGVPERHTCWCTLQDALVLEDLFCTRVPAHKSAPKYLKSVQTAISTF